MNRVATIIVGVALWTCQAGLCGAGSDTAGQEDAELLQRMQQIQQQMQQATSLDDVQGAMGDMVRALEQQRATGPARQAARWQQLLGLSEAQRARVEQIVQTNLDRNIAYFKKLQRDPALVTQWTDPTAAMATVSQQALEWVREAQAIQQDTIDGIKALLTPEQRQQFDRLFAASTQELEALVGGVKGGQPVTLPMPKQPSRSSTTPTTPKNKSGISEDYQKALLGGSEYWTNKGAQQDSNR